ncbi:MAG: preprotein translocase subunit SecG [Treponemataceae bacterium]|nr:preprotein translocase subunit SecG [Treponemataceae bacterium]
MGVIGTILLVVFVIICVLLIGVVLLQNEDGDGMGGIFGGAQSQAFGAKSGNVLTKATYVMVTLFFVATFVLALLNKTPSVRSLDAAAQEAAATGAESWLDSTPTEVAPAELSASTSVAE